MDTHDTIPPAAPETTNAENVLQFPKRGKNKGRPMLTPEEAESLVKRFTDPDFFVPIVPEDFDSHEDYLRRINIETLCNAFAMEIYFKLLNMGYQVNTPEFSKDLEFAQEAIHSALLRTFEIEHPIQEYVDENFEMVTVQTTTQELDT
jgi:hypothetical protein